MSDWNNYSQLKGFHLGLGVCCSGWQHGWSALNPIFFASAKYCWGPALIIDLCNTSLLHFSHFFWQLNVCKQLPVAGGYRESSRVHRTGRDGTAQLQALSSRAGKCWNWNRQRVKSYQVGWRGSTWLAVKGKGVGAGHWRKQKAVLIAENHRIRGPQRETLWTRGREAWGWPLGATFTSSHTSYLCDCFCFSRLLNRSCLFMRPEAWKNK